MRARESMERHERLALDTEEGGEIEFPIRPAFVVALIASLLAIMNLFSERAATRAILLQGEATDAWAQYNAGIVQAHINGDMALLLRGLARGDSRHRGLLREAVTLDKDSSGVLVAKQQKYAQIAAEYEHEREQAEDKHNTLKNSEAALGVAVVLGSVAILISSSSLLWTAVGLSVLGLLIGLVGVFTTSTWAMQ